MILLREKIVGFRRPLVCAGAGGLCTPGQKPAAGGRVRRPVPGAGRGDTVAVLDGREAALDADVVLVVVCAVGAGWRGHKNFSFRFLLCATGFFKGEMGRPTENKNSNF